MSAVPQEFGPDQGSHEFHTSLVGSEQFVPEPISPPIPKHLAATSGTSSSAPDKTNVGSQSKRQPSCPVADAILLLHADTLDDIEKMRIALENRLRSLTSEEEWGKGISRLLPEVTVLEGHLATIKALEHGAELSLKRAVRVHPFGPWIKKTIGVGEKQGARLLASIGDPATRCTVSQLWAYCGLHVVVPSVHREIETQDPSSAGDNNSDAHRAGDNQRSNGVSSQSGDHSPRESQWMIVPGLAPSRRKGQRANWNTTAKMRVFLIAESCVKQRSSPYRTVYDAGRAKYADSVHVYPCPRCGPANKPAPVDSPLSLGHQHARALRLVMKAILRDLWIEAQQLGTPTTT